MPVRLVKWSMVDGVPFARLVAPATRNHDDQCRHLWQPVIFFGMLKRQLLLQLPPSCLGFALGTVGLASLWLDFVRVFSYNGIVNQMQILTPVVLIVLPFLSFSLIFLYCLKAVYHFESVQEDASSSDGMAFDICNCLVQGSA